MEKINTDTNTNTNTDTCLGILSDLNTISVKNIKTASYIVSLLINSNTSTEEVTDFKNNMELTNLINTETYLNNIFAGYSNKYGFFKNLKFNPQLINIYPLQSNDQLNTIKNKIMENLKNLLSDLNLNDSNAIVSKDKSDEDVRCVVNSLINDIKYNLTLGNHKDEYLLVKFFQDISGFMFDSIKNQLEKDETKLAQLKRKSLLKDLEYFELLI